MLWVCGARGGRGSVVLVVVVHLWGSVVGGVAGIVVLVVLGVGDSLVVNLWDWCCVVQDRWLGLDCGHSWWWCLYSLRILSCCGVSLPFLCLVADVMLGKAWCWWCVGGL